MSDASFIPTVFFTLFFVVDPLGLIPVFVAYLAPYDAAYRKKVIIKATVISIGVSLFFIFSAHVFLRFIGITPGSFMIAGGILLFVIAMDMLLARPRRTQQFDDKEEYNFDTDIAVFPLAIPFLCGPGNIAALLMFSSQAQGDIVKLGIISIISIATFLIAMLVMAIALPLQTLLGRTGISVISKLMGLILSAMAVQFIYNGLVQMGVR
ncbi:MAG TPA: MarC family protein [Spirochaetota bacterium]|nr:MarC family protein [Spirochaetota bacterium]HQI38341.1 MarC family protein [Spirochaetota bacterium]HQK06445.1 MarC family protein [Spirochaetota bacterium]